MMILFVMLMLVRSSFHLVLTMYSPSHRVEHPRAEPGTFTPMGRLIFPFNARYHPFRAGRITRLYGIWFSIPEVSAVSMDEGILKHMR